MRYWIAFIACTVAATVPLLMTDTLPMADLPEHMAQVAIWKHYGDPCHRFCDTFELNFATPYLLGYGITRALAAFMRVSHAMAITVWLSIVLLPLSLRALLARGRGDVWLSLLGFPLAYGFAFYWGFLNYAVTIPVGIFYVALLFDRGRDVPRGLVALLALLGHGLVFIFCTAATLVFCATRRTLRPLLGLVPGLVLLTILAVRLRAQYGWMWEESYARLIDFPSLLLANAWEPWAALVVAAMAIAVAITRPRVTRDAARWALAVLALAAYFALPMIGFANSLIYQRFAVFAAAAVLFLFDEPRRGVAVSRGMVVAIVVIWMTVLAVRFRAFDAEKEPFDRLIAALPANRGVLMFIDDSTSAHVPGPVYLHYSALYQVRRGGVTAWSFANWTPQIVRYRPGKEMGVGVGPRPYMGIDWPNVLRYEYVLMRGSGARRYLLPSGELKLHARAGEWWLFETPRARTPQRACAPLNE
jgi:hypothetical protein